MPHATRTPPGRPRPDDVLDRLPPNEPRPNAAREGKPAAPPPPPDAADSPGTDARVPGTPAHTFIQGQADHLQKTAWGTYLYGALGTFFGETTHHFAYPALLDRFLAEVAPSGPVERMMAEAMFLSHHVAGQLSAKGMMATHPDAVRTYLGLAARMMAESRQAAAALRAGRNSPADPAPVVEAPVPPPSHARPAAEPGISDPPPRNQEPTPAWYGELVGNRLKGVFRDEPVPA
jgi:hypothetical protein